MEASPPLIKAQSLIKASAVKNLRIEFKVYLSQISTGKLNFKVTVV